MTDGKYNLLGWEQVRNIYQKQGREIGGEDVYKKVFDEGAIAFGLSQFTKEKNENPYEAERNPLRFAWQDGYRYEEKFYLYKFYNIKEIQDKIRKIIEDANLEIRFSEDSAPYIFTKEGQVFELINEN